MCGIVGAVSPRNVVPVLIDGIRRLEYRGYDSSGLAIIGGNWIMVYFKFIKPMEDMD